MGRGERNYPDYTFFTYGEKGYERCKMVVEAKYFKKFWQELESIDEFNKLKKLVNILN